MPKQNIISFALYQQRVLSCCLCESPSSCPALCNPIDYTARILKWVSFPFSRGSSQPRDRTQASHTAGGFFISWATREAHCLCGPDINWSSAKMLIRDAAHPFVLLLLPPAYWAEESIPMNHPFGSTKTYPKDRGHCFWWCHYIQCQIILSISLQGERKGAFLLF